MGPLSDGSVAVSLLNRSIASTTMTVSWPVIGLAADAKCNVRDLYLRKDLGSYVGTFSAEVESHGVVIVKITCVS